MMLLDALRPPSPFDPLADSYKDWLHLNLFDHASGIVGLLNVSLHGSPRDPRALSVGTALMRVPGSGWVGNCEIVSQQESHVGLSSVGLTRMGMALHGNERAVTGRVLLGEDGLEAHLLARSSGPPLMIEEGTPFGAGWISWSVVPSMSINGALRLWETTLELGDATAYFDHNWGRWLWGDDLGWEWGTFSSPPPGPCFVYNRCTDRAHRRGQPAMFLVESHGRRTIFGGPQMRFERIAFPRPYSRRLPGAAAALHEHRRNPTVPSTFVLAADDGRDWAVIEFETEDAVQILAPEPVRSGSSFIHEMAGRFTARGRIQDADVACDGLAVFEYVD